MLIFQMGFGKKKKKKSEKNSVNLSLIIAEVVLDTCRKFEF